MAKTMKRDAVLNLTMGGLFTAIVIVLQMFASAVRFGPFQISLVLIPIVIGAAVCGWKVSTWLGFVFGLVVLLNGDATAFLTINAMGTVITVLLKGAACGLAAGLIYKALEQKNRYLAVILSAIAAPVVNTGIFLAGCRLFFFETIKEWGAGAGFDNPVVYMIAGLVGINFLVEMASNIVVSPVILRIINAFRKR